MSDEVLGKTTIAPEVLHTIARLTALGVDGVSRMATSPNTINRVANKNDNEGVKIEIKDNTVFVDLFVILKSEENVRVVKGSSSMIHISFIKIEYINQLSRILKYFKFP